VISALPVTGCIAIGGGDTSNSPTLGQQLIDLQKAKDAGAITPEQYEAKRAEMMRK
jgi:hypothetical protein